MQHVEITAQAAAKDSYREMRLKLGVTERNKTPRKQREEGENRGVQGEGEVVS